MSRITINSNQLSLNAQRRLGDVTSSLSQSFNRLSSGLRINRAVDDAAGLAVSETLKLDSRLSTQALRNVNDGISMISIINGALDAQKGILYRMGELAEQSANGVMSSAHRRPLQAEYMSLQEEFDRVASSAKFNGISLLRNPDPTSISLMAGVTGADTSLLTVAAANSHRFAGVQLILLDTDNDNDYDFSDLTSDIINGPNSMYGEVTYATNTAPNFFQDFSEVTAKDSFGNSVMMRLSIYNFSDLFVSPISSAPDAPSQMVVQGRVFRADGTSAQSSSTLNYNGQTVTNAGKKISILATFADTASVSIELDFSSTNFLHIKSDDLPAKPTAIGFTNVRFSESAKHALDIVKNRIDDLSKLQGEFGAVEARLSVAANQLSVNRENFQSAASQITDVDVATEAATLTRTQILQ